MAPIAMLQNIAIHYVFATLAPQKHPMRSILAIFGPIMSATSQFGVKIGPSLAKCKQCPKPDDARSGYPSESQGPQNYEGQAKKAPMCSESLVAIELKGTGGTGRSP